MSERRGRLAAAFAATAALAALVAGCSTAESPTPGNTANAADATSSAPSKSGQPGSSGGQVAGVTDTQAAQLCSDMEVQLQNWRTYTPTLGKGGLNTVVISWASANGVDLLKLAGDRGQIDTI
ncbi:MAG: hypothetical protein FWE39_11990, partial [Nocardiaceae bacterium]|nr:hypothetical protein [Nocardiaceae bacterium]